MISITLDQKAVHRVMELLKRSPKEAHRAIATAENRTLTFLKKEIAKDVTHNYEIKSKSVKQTLNLKKASTANLEASVTSEAQSIYLGRFKVAPYNRKRQLWARVKKGKKKLMPGLFRSRPEKLPMLNMHRIGKERTIVKPFGPSVPQMIGNETVVQSIASKAHDMLNRRILHEIEWRFSKL